MHSEAKSVCYFVSSCPIIINQQILLGYMELTKVFRCLTYGCSFQPKVTAVTILPRTGNYLLSTFAVLLSTDPDYAGIKTSPVLAFYKLYLLPCATGLSYKNTLR